MRHRPPPAAHRLALVAGLAAWLLPGMAWAQDAAAAEACRGFSTVDMVECANKETAQWDKRLNTAYQAAMKAAGGGAAGPLRAAERAWIEYRKQRCTYLSATPGTISRVIAAGCMTEMTRARAMELETDAKSLGQN